MSLDWQSVESARLAWSWLCLATEPQAFLPLITHTASATLSCAQALCRLNGSRKDPGLALMRA